MDPQTPEQPTASGNSHKKLFIIIAAAVGVIILAVIGIVIALNQQKPTSKSDISAYLYDRPGYDRSKLGSGVADPSALTFDTFASVKTLPDDKPIVSACNVLTKENLTAEKVYLGTNPLPTVVHRTFIDGGGKAPVIPEEYTLPLDYEANMCNYLFDESRGMVQVFVYQPPIVPTSVVERELARGYDKVSVSGDDAGVAFFKDSKDREGEASYMMQTGNMAVAVQFRLEDKAVITRLLQKASQNVAALSAKPKGDPVTNYDSPLFKKSFARACDLITNDSIKSLTGNDAGQYVNESLSNAIGLKQSGENYTNYIQNTCSRSNTGLGSGLIAGEAFNQKLNVTAISYTDENGAKNQMKYMAKDAAEKVDVKIGDEAFGYKDTAGQNTLLLRHGRFVVEVVLNRTLQRGQAVSAMVEQLTPYAQEVVSKLKKL